MKSNIANILKRLTVPYGARSDQPRVVIATDDPLAEGMTSAGVSYYSDDMRGFITSIERRANGTGIWRLFARFREAAVAEVSEFVHVELDPVSPDQDYARYGSGTRNAGEPGRLEFFGNEAKLSGDSIELNGPTTVNGPLLLDPSHLTAVGAWSSFVPSWTCVVTSGGGAPVDPTPADASISARWCRVGNQVTYVGRITMGAATIPGVGEFRIGLPIPAAQPSLGSGDAWYFNSGGGVTARKSGSIWCAGASVIGFVCDAGTVGDAVPFVWGPGDQLRWSITYEVAA